MIMTYNLFFYANACHVCKSFGRTCRLRRCSRCRLISYCGEDHQKQHWPQHKLICNTVRDILGEEHISKLWETFEKSGARNRTQLKTNLMLLINIKIGRQLEPYERQMFLFPRACVVCYNQNSEVLIDCQKCPNTSFCRKHVNTDVHKSICPLFKLCFDLDCVSVLRDRQPPKIAVSIQTKHTYLPNNLKDFLEYYCVVTDTLSLSKEANTAYISEYLTRPLTLIYAMEKLGQFSKYTTINIHIIGANMIELDGLEIWESLLHWFSDLRTVKIVLVGPELPSGSMILDTCQDCVKKFRRIDFEIYSMFYDKYVNCPQFFDEPDLVVGYNAGIYECENIGSESDTWFLSMRSLVNQSCPFVLTAYTVSEAKQEQDRLNNILNNQMVCKHFSKNPFSSLRPHRDCETDQVYYQNNYIMIYTHEEKRKT